MFSVYGGKGVDPERICESRGLKPQEITSSGTSAGIKGIREDEATIDNKYYSFGPFNPTAG